MARTMPLPCLLCQAMMPQPGLQIYLWPHVTSTIDLLHPSCCDTMSVYRIMCLSGLVKSCWTVLRDFWPKGIFVTYFGGNWPWPLTSWPPDPLPGFEEGWGKGYREGKAWEKEKVGEGMGKGKGRNEAGRGVRERTGKGRGYDRFVSRPTEHVC